MWPLNQFYMHLNSRVSCLFHSHYRHVNTCIKFNKCLGFINILHTCGGCVVLLLPVFSLYYWQKQLQQPPTHHLQEYNNNLLNIYNNTTAIYSTLTIIQQHWTQHLKQFNHLHDIISSKTIQQHPTSHLQQSNTIQHIIKNNSTAPNTSSTCTTIQQHSRHCPQQFNNIQWIIYNNSTAFKTLIAHNNSTASNIIYNNSTAFNTLPAALNKLSTTIQELETHHLLHLLHINNIHLIIWKHFNNIQHRTIATIGQGSYKDTCIYIILESGLKKRYVLHNDTSRLVWIQRNWHI